jgi:AraC family transcriptional regulator of adaptative response/methylated-DNA-[protein]-cysteine methyltransferase
MASGEDVAESGSGPGPGGNGEFVFAVRTTGVCRPSCPARQPRRERSRSSTGPRGQATGFRACRRCHREARRDANWARDVCRQIEAGLDAPFRLSALAARLGVSAQLLQRRFGRILGVTPRQYADARRLHLVKAELRSGKDVAGALYEAGYSSSSRLYERSDAQLGMTPGTYRQGGAGMRIAYTIVACPLGRLVVPPSAAWRR